MRIVLAIFFPLGLTASAITISTDTPCFVTGFALAADANSCSLAPDYDFAQSRANASVAVTLGDTTIIASAANSIFALAGTGGVVSAASAFYINVPLITIGPVRSGFVTVTNTENWSLDPVSSGNSGSLTWSLGFIGGQCKGNAFSIDGSANCTNLGTFTVPFMLGTPFQLTESESIEDAVSPQFETFDTSFTSSNLSFSFTEADGVTPVQVFDPDPSVPEPASCFSAGIGLVALAVRRARR